MKTRNEFQQIVYGYWAKRFGCDRDGFLRPGTLILKEDELSGTGKVHLYHIDKMSIVRVDPCLASQAGLSNGYDRDSGSLTASKLQGLIGVEVETTFLDCYLDVNDFRCFTAKGNFTTRRLYGENDNPHLLNLYQACMEEDLDEAAINVDEPDPVIYGMFDGNQLVAYASHRYWEDVIADMGVLIHPGYRGRGLGKAVVSALCEWCIENEIVPMYRVFSYNTHSRGLAQALGFKELVVIETLKLMKEESAT